MQGRRVALLSIDPWVGAEAGFRPFNYSVRKLQASLLSEGAPEGLDVRVFDFFSVRTDELVRDVEAFDPDFIGCSAYVWSLPSFCDLARKFKQARPDRVVVFGGPSARPAMLSLEPFRDAIEWVDALCLGEGEEIIREMTALPALSRASLRGVAGLAVPDAGAWVNTAERPRIADLDTLASPQQMGLARAHGAPRELPRVPVHLHVLRVGRARQREPCLRRRLPRARDARAPAQ